MDRDQQSVIGNQQARDNADSALGHAALLNRQGAESFRQYDATKSIHEINKAIQSTNEAVSIIRRHGPQVQGRQQMLDACLGNLANFYHVRYEATNAAADLTESIGVTKQQINLNLRNNEPLVNLLAARLRDRSLRTGSVEHQSEAVKTLRAVLDGTSSSDSTWLLRLNNLGFVFLGNYRHRKSEEDIEEALRLFKYGIDNTPKDHEHKPQIIHGFGSSLYERYMQAGSEDDLYAAIENLQEAVASPLRDQNERVSEVLGSAIFRRYERKGSRNDLEEYIMIQKFLLQKFPKTISRPQRLNSLGVGYRCQHLESGEERSLLEAMARTQEALEATDEDHEIYAFLRHNLGLCFGDRYRITRSQDDLGNAIQNIEVATNAYKEHDRFHAERMGSKNSLQALLRERHRRYAFPNDLQRAMSIAQDVVEGTPKNDPHYATYLSNLAGLYYDAHFTDPENMNVVNEAIRLREVSLSLTPANHAERVEMLSKLSVVYHHRFQYSGSADDLNAAFNHGDAAVKLTVEEHRKLGARVANLGILWRDLQHIGKSDNGFEQAIKCLTKALRQSNNPPLQRVKAGNKAADIAIISENWGEAAEYLRESMDLLPRVALRSNSREDHQDNLKQISDLGPKTASVLLKAQESSLIASQVLEQARGIISNLVMESRSDISLLKQQHPNLSSSYGELREIVATFSSSSQIHHPTSDRVAAINEVSMLDRRTKAIKKLNDVENEIREQPGFERFLLGPTDEDIHELAQDGPIVSYNITEFGSHVFLITAQAFQVLSLPQFSKVQLTEQIDTIPTGNRARRNMTKKIKNDLKKVADTSQTMTQEQAMRLLWANAIEPVLNHLGLLRSSGCADPLPCIWWVGGGLMALLPLHAAGNHKENSTDNTMTHVISSYMPTLKALGFSRNRPFRHLRGDNNNALIVAMPQTPDDHSDLQVDAEVESMRQQIESTASIDILDRPTRNQVLEHLKTASLAHFACHGSSDQYNPSDSALLLGKTKLEKLTVKDLQPLNHQLAQVAYLSACSTAEIGVRNLVDESIHLASMFQLVGFRHVIGTLWGAADDAAVQVAAKFYQYLFRSPDSRFAVARALHQAVSDLKANSDNFDWAPFIHFGP